jgi:hypothetical protein
VLKKIIIIALITLLNVQESQAMVFFGLFKIGGEKCALGGWGETTVIGETYRGFIIECRFGLPIEMSCQEFYQNQSLLSNELIQVVNESGVCEGATPIINNLQLIDQQITFRDKVETDLLQSGTEGTEKKEIEGSDYNSFESVDQSLNYVTEIDK